MPGIGIGISPLLNRGGGTDWSSYWTTQGVAELIAYNAGLTTPLSVEQNARLETFIKAIKTGFSSANLSDDFDVIRFLGGQTAESSLRNLVKNAHHGTAVNSPTFTQYESFTGDGLASYIDDNYNPSTEAEKYTQNNASFGVYLREILSTTPIGVTDVNSISTFVTSAGASFVGINSPAASAPTVAVNQKGLISAYRDGNNISLYQNKSLVISSNQSIASAALSNANFWTLARNRTSGGSPTYSNTPVGFMFIGRLLSATERNVLVDAVEAYFDSLGKGVV